MVDDLRANVDPVFASLPRWLRACRLSVRHRRSPPPLLQQSCFWPPPRCGDRAGRVRPRWRGMAITSPKTLRLIL